MQDYLSLYKRMFDYSGTATSREFLTLWWGNLIILVLYCLLIFLLNGGLPSFLNNFSLVGLLPFLIPAPSYILLLPITTFIVFTTAFSLYTLFSYVILNFDIIFLVLADLVLAVYCVLTSLAALSLMSRRLVSKNKPKYFVWVSVGLEILACAFPAFLMLYFMGYLFGSREPVDENIELVFVLCFAAWIVAFIFNVYLFIIGAKKAPALAADATK